MSQQKPLYINPTTGQNAELTGADTLRVEAAPIAGSDAANKDYVDSTTVHNLDGGFANSVYGGTLSIDGGGA